MKIYFNIITAACIVFLIAFSFTGYGKSDDSQGGIEIHDIAGSWTLTSFRVGDREYDMKEYFDKYGVNSRDYEMKFNRLAEVRTDIIRNPIGLMNRDVKLVTRGI